MHPQLEALLELQDLKTQRRDLEEVQGREVQESVFGLEPVEALRQLDEKIVEMEEALDPPVRTRYRRVAARNPRTVVPVIRGTCYGCFVQVPTARSSDADRNGEIRTCENCGRFLYYVD